MWSPLGYEPVNQTARWQPEPATRGTFSILATCLTTLVLCVWTALHLNIPQHGKINGQKYHKAYGILLGLLVPEFVILTAWAQWRAHKRITNAIKDKLKKQQLPRHEGVGLEENSADEINSTPEHNELRPIPADQERLPLRHYDWTPAHSFYALMGGFAFEGERLACNEPQRVQIHPDLLVELAKYAPDIIPDISSRYIRDKSKTNHLAKLLVCAQASWFGLQVLTRLGLGLAVTLLELNVLGHVICAILVYAFWWKKPLDIYEPTLIDAENPKAGSVCAALRSRISLRTHTPLVVQRGQSEVELMRDERGNTVSIDQMTLSLQRAQELRDFCHGSSNASRERSRHPPDQRYTSKDTQLRLVCLGQEDFSSPSIDDRILIGLAVEFVQAELRNFHIRLDPGVLALRDRVYASFEYDHLQRHLYAHSHSAGRSIISSSLDHSMFQSKRASSMLSNRTSSRAYELIKNTRVGDDFLFLAAASVLYGAPHLTAWNGPFRTELEGILWKVSALGVVLPLLLAKALLVLTIAVNELEDLIRLNVPLKASRFFTTYLCGGLKIFFFSLLVLDAFFLHFCRGYLLVESFISLAYAPDAVFAVPQWSNYFPHIG